MAERVLRVIYDPAKVAAYGRTLYGEYGSSDPPPDDAVLVREIIDGWLLEARDEILTFGRRIEAGIQVVIENG